MIASRDRLALVLAGAAVAVLLVTAYGFWSHADAGNPALPLLVIPLHVLATLAWVARPSIRRRFVVAFGLTEVVVGVGYFATATILRGRFAPPGESLISTAHVWALAGLAVAGALVVLAGLTHSSRRQSKAIE